MDIDNPITAGAAAGKLTPGQRECLRLVAQLQSSKQIARALGISRYSVDQRIGRACRVLGATTRTQAALMLANIEGAEPHRGAYAETGKGAEEAGRPMFAQFTGPRGAPEPLVSDRMLIAASGPGLPFPTKERPANNLSFFHRVGWAIVIAAGSIVVAGVLLASLAALKEFF